jgi:two-component system LytT family response regulator
MKAILVDDEKPALIHLERMLKENGQLEVAATFTKVREALDYIGQTKVDFVFLDIGMPEMDGLEAAIHFQQYDSHIRIVYVTAYSEYAIEAFELNALDYLLKPVNSSRLARTIERMLHYAEITGRETGAAPKKQIEPIVSMFQRLELSPGKSDSTRLKWRTAKAQELFTYLLQFKGRWVDKDHIAELIWPDFPAEKATTHLHTSIYQIRKMLKEWGEQATVDFAQDCYRLTADGVMTDVEIFEHSLAGVLEQPSQQNHTLRNQVINLYVGPYLYEHDYRWAKSRMDYLHQKFIDFLIAVSHADLEAGQPADALRMLLNAQEKDPYSEPICRMIMTVYATMQHYDALDSYYSAFVQMMQAELGVEPELLTKQTYEKLRENSVRR